MTTPERAVDRRAGALPEFPTLDAPVTLDDRLSATDPVVALPRALLVAQERAAWLGDRLREQIDREGVDGVVGVSYQITADGRAVQVSEFTRSLAEQERREREHVAAVAEKCARLGISDGAQARDADVAQWIARGIRALVGELGMDPQDPDTVVRSKRAFAAVWQQRQGRAWTTAERRSYFGTDGMPDAGAPTQ